MTWNWHRRLSGIQTSINYSLLQQTHLGYTATPGGKERKNQTVVIKPSQLFNPVCPFLNEGDEAGSGAGLLNSYSKTRLHSEERRIAAEPRQWRACLLGHDDTWHLFATTSRTVLGYRWFALVRGKDKKAPSTRILPKGIKRFIRMGMESSANCSVCTLASPRPRCAGADMATLVGLSLNRYSFDVAIIRKTNRTGRSWGSVTCEISLQESFQPRCKNKRNKRKKTAERRTRGTKQKSQRSSSLSQVVKTVSTPIPPPPPPTSSKSKQKCTKGKSAW